MKCFDVGIYDITIITVPKLSEKGRQLADFYRIKVFTVEALAH